MFNKLTAQIVNVPADAHTHTKLTGCLPDEVPGPFAILLEVELPCRQIINDQTLSLYVRMGFGWTGKAAP
jgi:hypothetical protein